MLYSAVLLNYVLALIALPLSTVSLLRYIPRLRPAEPETPRWWLCCGIVISFVAVFLASCIRIHILLSGLWIRRVDQFDIESLLIGHITQILAILAGLCHIRAATSWSGRQLSRADYATTLLVAVVTVITIFLLT